MRSKLFIFFFIIFLSFVSISSARDTTDILRIQADKIDYSQNDEALNATGNVKISHENGISVKASKVTYNKKDGLVKIDSQFELIDNFKRSIFGEQLLYNINEQLITAEKKIIFQDEKNNKFFLSKIIADDKFENILGYNLVTDLEKNPDFKNSKPRLEAKKINIKGNISTLYDARFTTCREENKIESCPYWNLKADEIIHDRAEKSLSYKNAKLELNEVPVLYTPYFSHPDPTVKRKSGLLAPNFSSLGQIGNTIKIPYFFAVSENRDLTLSPVYYFDQHPLLLAEYREKFKSGDFSLEGGITQGYKKTNPTNTSGSRYHLFGNYNQSFLNKVLNDDNLNIKIQRVNNPTYLRVNKINSTDDKFKRNLIKENLTQLNNEISLNSFSRNEKLNLKIAANQNIGVTKTSDQYEYVYPEINFSKFNLFQETFYDSKVNSILRQINKNTNQYKTSLVNNFYANSQNYYLDNGIKYKFLGQLNNINYDSNFNDPKKNTHFQVNPVLGIDSSYPLVKRHEVKQEYFIPRILTKYSPGKMKNARSNDLLLTTDNLFSLDRMNSEELVEKNLSFNFGFDWILRDDKKNLASPITEFSLGQVIKFDNDLDMPTKSSLDKKKSDFVTKFSYSNPNNFEINSKNNIRDNFKDLNYTDINLKTYFQKTSFNFNFFEKNNYVGSERKYIANFISPISSNFNIKFETEKNLKTDRFTNNNLLIEYINECIKYGLTIRKDYSSDKDLKPGSILFFEFTLLPFGSNISVPGFSN